MTIHSKFATDLLALLGGAKALRITCDGYMPLSIEDIGTDAEGRRLISLCHYGEQNGDLMRDPEMIFALRNGMAEPISFRNDYMGIDQESYIYGEDGKRTHIRPKLKREFESFARTWFSNLREQGFFTGAREILS